MAAMACCIQASPVPQDDHLHLLGSRAHRHALVPRAVQHCDIPLCIIEEADSETMLQDA